MTTANKRSPLAAARSHTRPLDLGATAAFTLPQLASIGLALVVGALLRLVANNQPFPSSDHAEVAAIVTFFYPRSLASLAPSAGSSWNMLTNPHGLLSLLIAFGSSTVLGLLGVHLNEFWWNAPFVLVHLAGIALVAALVRRLAGGWAGAIAALLIAIMPIHAVMSRSSGVGNMPLTFECQALSLLCALRYYETPSPRRARQLSLALALNLLVELFFPLLFVLVLGAGVLTVETESGSFGERLRRARALLFQPSVMLLPLLAIVFNFVLLLLHVAGWTQMGGLAARLLSGSDRKAGMYLGDFWENSSYVVGALVLMILFALGVANALSARRLEPRSLPLYWSILYLAPFVFFTRPHVFEYFLLGLAPLLLNASIVIDGWFGAAQLRRGLAALALALLVALLSLRSLSMIFGIDAVALAGTGKANGAVFPDQGLKAAAWWLRNQTTPETLIFADAAFEPYQLAYYVRRPFLAVTDAEQPEDAYRLLDQSPKTPTFYLVVPGNEALLRAHAPAAPGVAATVSVDGQPVLLVFGPNNGTPQTIDSAEANRRFDQQFGAWRSMFAIGTRQ
jgi:hypothetical protein